MQKQELYNKIRTRINELVPRLQTSFYCGRCNKDGYTTVSYGHDGTLEMCKRIYDFKEPHLEDLLEAIEIKTGLFVKTDKKITFLDKDYNAYFSYNLSLSLENQSLETLESFNKLLN